MRCGSACTLCSVGPPAGTISQATRGLPSLPTKSSSDDEAIAPSRGNVLHVVGAEVGDDDFMSAAHQAPRHVGAHFAQADHSQSHVAP